MASMTTYVVGLLNAAPAGWADILDDFVDVNGITDRDLALILTTLPVFTDLYPADDSDADFTASFLNNLLGDTVSADNMALANTVVVGALEGGMSRGEAAVTLIDLFDAMSTDDPDWGAAAQQLDNRTTAADASDSDATDIADMQAVIAGVTDDPATIPGDDPADFTLTAGLADLDDANDALVDFFKAVDLTGDAVTGGPDGEADFVDADGDLTSATDARAAVVGSLTTAVSDYEGETGIDNYGDANADSAVLQAAKLADAQAADAAALVAAQELEAYAQADVDAIDGLQVKIDAVAGATADVSDATDELADAEDAELVTDANLAGAIAAYDTLNAADVIDAVNINIAAVENDAVVTDTTDSTVLIKMNAAGVPALAAEAIVEADFPGVTALLAAVTDSFNAAVATDAATTVLSDANDALAALDLAGVLADAQDAVDAAIGVDNAGVADNIYGEMLVAQNDMEGDIAGALGGEASYAAVLTALEATINGLTFADTDANLILALEGELDGLVSADDIIAISTAFSDEDPGTADPVTADFGVAENLAAAKAAAIAALEDNNFQVTLDAFNVLLADFVAADAEFTAADALATEEEAVSDAQDDIDALADAITALAAAEELNAGLEEADAAIVTAQDAIEDEGYTLPVTLADDDALTATAGGDIYMISDLVDTDFAEIDAFSDEGADVLYIGSDFTFNAGDFADDGDNAALEVFLTESGSDTLVQFETVEFGSNAGVPEFFQIELTGVAIADVTVADGMITVA